MGNDASLGTGPTTMSAGTTLSLGSGITTNNNINFDPSAIGSINVAEGTGTLSGVIAGASSALWKRGAGVLSLSGANTYDGGGTLLDGEIFIGNNTGLGTGVFAMFAGTTLSLGSGISASNNINLWNSSTGNINVAEGIGTLSGVIAGATSTLVKGGAGILTLSGANTYSGGTTLLDGVLSISADNNLGTTFSTLTFNGGTLQAIANITSIRPVTLTGSGTINVVSDSLLMFEVFSGAGHLTKSGPGRLSLVGNNTYSGGTTLSEGEISVANGAALGTGALAMSNRTLLSLGIGITANNDINLDALSTGSINVANGTGTLSGGIAGVGSILEKTGAGMLTLSGDNTYSGGTTVLNGIISIAADNNLGNSLGMVTFNSGTLQTTAGFSSSRAATFTGPGTIEVLGDSLTMSGVFSGAGALTKTGAGMLTLSGDNTYSGGTTLLNGVVSIAADNNLGNVLGALTFNGGTLQSTANSEILRSTVAFSSSRAATFTGPGTIEVLGDSLTMGGIFSGAGALTKTGAGILLLSGENTYTGGSTLSEGEIFLGHNAGLGTGAAALSGGTTLSLGSDITADNDINFEESATGVINVAAGTGTLSGVIAGVGSILEKTGDGILLLSGENTYTGGTTLSEGEISLGHNAGLGTGAAALSAGTTLSLGSDITANNAINFDPSATGVINVAEGTGTLSGVIAGIDSILEKTGDGILLLSGENTYSGGTTLSAGEISLGHNAGLGTGAAALSAGTTLSLGSDITADNDINFEGAATGVINVAEGTGTLSGVIAGIDSILEKRGDGILLLSGENTYTGGTTLSEGEISLGHNAGLGTGAAAMSAGTTLSLGSDITADNAINFEESATGVINVAAGTGTLSGVIAGIDSILEKTGDGILILSGENAYTGGTTLSEGEVAVGNNGALGTGAAMLSDGTTLSLHSGITISNAVHLTSSSGGSVNVAEGTGRLLGVIDGVDSILTKTGAGMLRLSGENTYSGGTILSEGEISVGNNSALGTGAAALSDGTILSLESGITVNNAINLDTAGTGSINAADGAGPLSGVIAGESSILAKTGDGTLLLSGDNTYSGGTTLLNGILSVAADNNLGNALGALTFNGGTLQTTAGFSSGREATFTGPGKIHVLQDALTMSGIFSGAGGLSKTGMGTLTLSGENIYSGGTTLSEGEVVVANNAALGTGSATMRGGTTLSLANGIIASNVINLEASATGSINVAEGTGTLSGGITRASSILTKTGAGMLRLSGENTYSGGTEIVKGTVSIAADNNLRAPLGTLTLDNGTLQTTEAFSSARDTTLIMSGIIDVQVDSLTMTGIFSGAGYLVKTGPGMLILSGPDTYSGGTVLLEGTIYVDNIGSLVGKELSVKNSSALGTGSILMKDGTTLDLDSEIDVSNIINLEESATGTINVAEGIGALSGVISGVDGILAKRGAGTLTLDGTNTYNGGTILFGGEIFVGNNRALGTGVITMSDGTTLSLGRGITTSNAMDLDAAGISSVDVAEGTGTVSGVIAGGTLAKTGTGNLILSGKNSYTGATLLNGGKLSISSASNLGSGTLFIDKGSLSSLASFTLPTNILLVGIEEIEVPTGTLTLSGQIEGVELVKTGMGTLSLSEDNTYSGLSTINAGTLQLLGSGTLGSGQGLTINEENLVIAVDAGTKAIGILNGGGSGINLNNNILEIGRGSFTGDISGIGGGLIKTSNETLILSGTNTFTGNLSINQGILQVSTGNNLGTGDVVLDGGTLSPLVSMTIDQAISVTAASQIDTASDIDVTVAGTISGTSNLTQLGVGRLSLTGDSPMFRGTTTVEEGSLHVQGVLGGPVMVSADAFLGGIGSVGTVQNSGTVIPGASIGTLSIMGDYTQDASASLIVEIEDDPFRSDLLLVTGTANLDGNIVLNPLPGTYEKGTVFTVLQANTVNGTFSQFVETHPIAFELKYLANAVQIIIPSSQAVLPIPLNKLEGNAKNIAQYLFTCSLRNLSAELVSIARTLARTSPENFPAALRQLGPQQFGSLALANLQTSTRVGLSMNQTSDVYDNYYLTSGDQSGKDAAFAPHRSIWLNPIGYYYKHNEVEEQVPFNSSTYGFTTGFRTRFNRIIVSAGTGYTHSNLNWFQNNGGAHIQSVYLSPSIGYISEYGYAGLVLLGSRSFYDVDRKISFSNFRAEAHNNHKSYDLLAGLRGSLKVQYLKNSLHNFFLLQTINLDYLNIFESGYQESGAGAIDLSVKNMHSAFLRPEVTLKLLKEWNTPFICSSPSIYIGWLRNIPLTNGSYTSRFYKQAACEKNFMVQSYENTTDQLVVGAEVLVMYKARGSLKFGYEANIGNHYSVHEGKLNFNWAF